jgi:hypothetical protein
MVFSVPTFATVGDDYDKKPQQTKKPGRTFLTPGPKSGTLPDATFSKDYRSIHEGDPYIDQGTAERRVKMESVKKRLNPVGFRLSSPPKKACGLGSYFGTFQDKPTPHETDYVVPRKGEAPPRKPAAPRPMLTNPTRKGTYGVAGTLLSPIGQEYVADFYDSRRQKDREDHEKHKQLVKGAPWKGGGRKGYTFDEGEGTGVSTCYQLTKPLSPRHEHKATYQVKGPEAPWRPGGKLPVQLPPVEYREDPYDGYDPRTEPRKKAETAPSGTRAGWRPNGQTNDFWYTKSIAFGRL